MAERKAEDLRVRKQAAWWLWLALIAGGAVAVRLWLAFWLPTQPVDDFWSYLARAETICRYGIYGPFPDRPDASYPPAYPLYLAGAIRLLGGDPLFTAKLANYALAFISVVLAGGLGRVLGGRSVGLVAASLLAFLPRGLLVSQIIASENLLQPFLFGFFLLAILPAGVVRPTLRVVVAGLLLGLCTLTRVSAYALSIVWPFAARCTARRAWKRELVFLLLVQHLVLLPWALRNEATLGKRIWLTSTSGVNLFIGHNDRADGGWVFWREELSRVVPNLDSMSIVEIDAAAGKAARHWILLHPRKTFRLFLTKVHRLLLEDERYLIFYSLDGVGSAPPPSTREVLPADHFLKDHQHVLRRLLLIAHFGTAGVALLVQGIVLFGRRLAPCTNGRPKTSVLVLGLGAVYFIVVASIYFAASRFRWPAIDLLTIAAACAVGTICSAGSGSALGRLSGRTGST